jgi:hypothetical protein
MVLPTSRGDKSYNHRELSEKRAEAVKSTSREAYAQSVTHCRLTFFRIRN